MANLNYITQAQQAAEPWVARLIQKSHDALEILPGYESIRHTPGAIMAEGLIGGYLLTWSLQGISKKFMPEKFDKYALPVLERLCQIGIPVGTAAWGVIDPESANKWFETYPIHNLGLFMAYTAGLIRAQQDLSKREVKPLDDFVKAQWNKLKK
jgi:hypothetical protein